MRIELRISAIKDLQRIDRQQKQRLHEAIGTLGDFPDVPNLKKLTNFEPAYRLRVGDYRVLFDVVEETIVIGRVPPSARKLSPLRKVVQTMGLQPGAW